MSCKCYHAEKNFVGKIGVCWGTKEREACFCGGDEAKCDFYDYVRNRAKNTITNADRIRAMTDEELYAFRFKSCPGVHCVGRRCIEFRAECRECWLAWLKEEVQE